MLRGGRGAACEVYAINMQHPAHRLDVAGAVLVPTEAMPAPGSKGFLADRALRGQLLVFGIRAQGPSFAQQLTRQPCWLRQQLNHLGAEDWQALGCLLPQIPFRHGWSCERGRCGASLGQDFGRIGHR